MGELTVIGLIMLIVIMAIPVSMLVAGVVYCVRLARKGPEATLAGALKLRELA